MDATLLAIILFVAVAMIVGAVLMLVRDLVLRSRLAFEQRLSNGETEVNLERMPTEAPEGRGPIRAIDRFFYQLVSETDVFSSAEAAFLAAIAVGLLPGAMVFLWRENVVLSVIVAVAATIGMLAYLLYLRTSRRRAVREQLPEVTDRIARAVRAGESLDQAIALVGDTAPDPLGREFRRCSRQLAMGLSMDAAMRVLTRRTPIMEMRILAATITVQRRGGGNLSATLERLATVMRDRLSYFRQFRAATAAARIGTVLIAAAGPFVVVVLAFSYPDYVYPLVEHPVGRGLMTAAIILQILGIAWVYRLMRVDY